MSRCLAALADELCEEWKARKMEICLIARCSTGPLPAMTEDDRDDPPALLKDDDNEEDPEFEEGDRMFAAGLHHPTAEIRATSTISQRLVEAFKWNSEPADGISGYLHKFDNIFSRVL
jgi:hypothetical protein